MADTLTIRLNREDAMVLALAMTETPHLPWDHLSQVIALAIMDQKTGPIGPEALDTSDEAIEEALARFREHLEIDAS